jgi:hypothetical protein
MSESGVSDIIGTLPGHKAAPPESTEDALRLASTVKGSVVASSGEAAIVLARRVVELESRGRGLFIEMKAPGGTMSDEQKDFIFNMHTAGAVAFTADNPALVVAKLAEAGYEPARRLRIQFGGGRTHGGA